MKTLFLTLITTFLLTSYGKSQNNKNKTDTTIELVDAKKFKELITHEGTILDVRTPNEWAEGIIEGAVKINYFNTDFTKQLEKLDKTKPVYVYCKVGGRSSGAAKKLKKSGFTKIYDLDGGITAWDSLGYPKVK